jgi:hypothetical protein
MGIRCEAAAMGEVQPADPTTRRRALIAVAVIAMAGWGLYFGLEQWLAGLRGSSLGHVRDSLERALIWSSWATFLPITVLAAFMWRYGARVCRAERFPAPGAKVVRDTPVLRGKPARRRGTALQVLAAGLALLSAGALIAVYRLIARLHA